MTSRLTEEELDMLKRMDGPPPYEDLVTSRAIQPLAIRAVDELRAARESLKLLRARLAELELSEEDREALRFVLTLLAHNESGLTWLVDSTAVDHRMRCREAIAVINRLARRGDK